MLGGEALTRAFAHEGRLAPGADARDAWSLGAARLEAGRRAEAIATWRAGTQAEARRADELLGRGHCRRALLDLAGASRDYVAAIKAAEDEGDEWPDLLVALADLYFEADREVEAAKQRSAAKLYDQALALDPDHEGALLGQYALHDYNWLRQRRGAGEFLERALKARPRSVRALLAATGGDLVDGDLQAARLRLATLAEQAPARRAVRAAQGALAFLSGDAARAEVLVAALEGEDPGDSSAPALLGRALVEQYRFAEAIPWLERAVARDPDDHEALTYLGRAQANTGDEAAALRTLDRSAEAARGRADAWRDNMRLVLTRMAQRHVVVGGGELTYSFEQRGREVLEAIMSRFYSEARAELAARYGFTPSPTRIEIFSRQADFSVRSVGFEGFPALGVCFGPVVTAVSPLSELRGTQSWARTAYHEFTHVIHLGISKNRCPRWITEGIATWEEETRNPAWTRNLRRELVDAIANDDLLECRTINRAFRGPRVIYAYYQSGLMVRMVVEKRGFAPLVRLLEAFEQGADLDQAFRECLETTPEAFDRDFEAWARAWTAPLKIEPRLSASTVARLRANLGATPPADDAARTRWADGWVGVARASFAAGKRVDAEDALRRLKALPVEPPRAALLRGDIALQQDDDAAALSQYQRAFAAGADDYRARFTAGKLLEAQSDDEAAIAMLEAALAAFPGWDDPGLSAELELAAIHRRRGDEDKALEYEERRLDWDAGNMALRLRVAEAWTTRGRPERAVLRLEECVEVDPFVRTVHRRLAEAQEAVGDHAGAARSWSLLQKVPAELDGLDGTPTEESELAAWIGREALALAKDGRCAEARERAAAALALVDDETSASEAAAMCGEGK
jgi:predicted Zn-dependent protease